MQTGHGRAIKRSAQRNDGVPAGQSRKALAYSYIQSRIVSGELRAGEAISEVPLAEKIGISRTPVREAVGQLTAEGFLKHMPGRGTVVNLPTRTDIVELYELREALEVYAVGKVARQPLPPGDFEKLDQMCQEVADLAQKLEQSGERCLDPAAMERFLVPDMRFHMLLLRAAGNNRILKVIRDTRLMIRIFHLQHEGHDVRQLRQIYASHKAILGAVRNADPTLAMNLCGEHIRLSCKERLEAYDRWERMSQIRVDDTFLLGLDAGQ
jgi:DNA-binding GntR family transcriptional regulator